MTTTHHHSAQAEIFAEKFANLSVAEMIAVQRVYVKDHYDARQRGMSATAEMILERAVNPMGEAIDMRDGTCRECAEERAA